MSKDESLLPSNSSLNEKKISFASSIDVNRTSFPFSLNNSDSYSDSDFFLSQNEDILILTPPKEEKNIINIHKVFPEEEDIEELEMKNELFEYKKNLTNFKSQLKQKKQINNIEKSCHHHYSNSDTNTLTLIEKEMNLEEEAIIFENNDKLNLIDKNNYPPSSLFKRKTNSLYDKSHTLVNRTKPKQYSFSLESHSHIYHHRNSLSSNISSNNEYFLNYSYGNKADAIRSSYIAKLIYSGILVPNQNQNKHNSIIIFDWDDTLLCTSFIMPNGIYDDNKSFTYDEQLKISQLELSVLALLEKSITKGRTFIITNSLPGWVEFSANKFYPKLSKILDKITIISARGKYEKMYPWNISLWKIKAFVDMVQTIDCSLITNIVCVGDSFIEIEAGKALASKFSMACIKSVKFKESPKIEELNKQIILVNENFEKIFSQAKNLNISIEKKSNDEN